jgi:methylmalonyl-CoA mutase
LAKELLAKGFKRSICVDISLHQNAGAAIYQQLGIALAKTKELIEVYGSEIFGKLIFKIAVGGNYFFEMAKLRAFKIVLISFPGSMVWMKFLTSLQRLPLEIRRFLITKIT